MNSHVISFSDIEIRNEFIKSFNKSFNDVEVGKLVGLAKSTTQHIRSGFKANKKYIEVTCPDCKEKRKTRQDHVLKTGNTYCKKCSSRKPMTGKNIVLENCSSCGVDFKVSIKTWNSGKTKCISCRNPKPSMIDKGLAAKNRIFRTYKRNARRKGLSFNISFGDFIEIATSDCFYCGIIPSNVSKSKNGDFLYNGMDRIDNNKGYNRNNLVSCCKICNYSKNTQSKNNFYNWVEKTFLNLKNKGEI